ncbi:hypothetical protein Moror_2563 [Moniliophthora roreri MCA 2997]|uniref:DUF4384 domain-containing protein n=2 Tax=Moniliophthora roreri TaxID=221103 RepID=V2WXG5_MONRO|nr:hypothetical protein Moror_2563 [Moniliophthora roreri MCA 2997]KAI3619173.1 hypothetical protein WG66_013004 [Moniliophthora roreri]
MSTRVLLVLLSFLVCVSAYFVITQPARGAVWQNGMANSIAWNKGVLDGTDRFDIEITRLKENGLLLVARDVPVNPPSLNVHLDDVPPGDDYFLLFLNSTPGVVYTTSQRFSVLPSNAQGAYITPPNPDVPTITVSGAPNPTRGWITTFPALKANSAAGPELIGSKGSLVGVLTALAVCATAFMMTLW